MTMKELTLWTALITPMHKDGSIHFEDLEKLVRRQEKAGNGILLIGSTGEGLALSPEEKKEVVEFTAGLNLSVPLMVGVGGFQAEAQKEWIEECNRLDTDAFLLVTPLYSKPGPEGQIQWFNTLLDASAKPCMVYNIPSRTGIKLEPEVLKRIEGHKNFWSIKEASGSIADFQRFRETSPSVPLFSGDDGMLAFFVPAGCRGLVSVASNVWPEETKLYVEKCLKGETESLFPLWNHAAKALFSASNPVPAKALLKQKNILETAALRLPLTADELSSDMQNKLKKADEAVQNWYHLNHS